MRRPAEEHPQRVSLFIDYLGSGVAIDGPFDGKVPCIQSIVSLWLGLASSAADDEKLLKRRARFFVWVRQRHFGGALRTPLIGCVQRDPLRRRRLAYPGR